MGNWDKELEFGRMLARRAGEVALRHRERGLEADTKPDASPVTAGDRESEQLIASSLSESFPEDGFLGEEGALRESRNGRRWIIDPIDGTREYLRGSPAWAVLIGLEVDHEMEAGIAYFPATGDMYSAARGAGAFRNEKRIQISAVSRPEQAVLCINGLNDLGRHPFAPQLIEWISKFWAVRSLGGCLDAVMVAGGQAEIWVEPSAKPWDLAALKVIVEEAGARFFNFDGSHTIYGGNCVVCVPALESMARLFVGQRAPVNSLLKE